MLKVGKGEEHADRQADLTWEIKLTPESGGWGLPQHAGEHDFLERLTASLHRPLAWQPTSHLPKDLGAEAGQGPESCSLSESLTPKGFQESKKRAGSREEAGARANSHRHFLCWEMCSLLVPREQAPPAAWGWGGGQCDEAVWAAKLTGGGWFVLTRQVLALALALASVSPFSRTDHANCGDY